MLFMTTFKNTYQQTLSLVSPVDEALFMLDFTLIYDIIDKDKISDFLFIICHLAKLWMFHKNNNLKFH